MLELTWCHPHHGSGISLTGTVSRRKIGDKFVDPVQHGGEEVGTDEPLQLVYAPVWDKVSSGNQDDWCREHG